MGVVGMHCLWDRVHNMVGSGSIRAHDASVKSAISVDPIMSGRCFQGVTPERAFAHNLHFVSRAENAVQGDGAVS